MNIKIILPLLTLTSMLYFPVVLSSCMHQSAERVPTSTTPTTDSTTDPTTEPAPTEPAPTEPAPPDPAPTDPTPTQPTISASYDTSQITLISSQQITQNLYTFQVDYYENSAYKCGRTGNFGFLVVQKPGQGESPLWVTIHGGGIGYYDDTGAYHPASNEGHNDAEGATKLTQKVTGFIGIWGNIQDKLAGRRFVEGYRFMMPSLCDHDAYSGLGTPYAGNPNYGVDGDTVDGLLATMAALDFTVNGTATINGYPTTHIFVQGASAGSVGAYSLTRALRDQGTLLNGTVLDSFVINERYKTLAYTGCTPPSLADNAFNYNHVLAKLGRFSTEPGLMVDGTFADTAGFEVPVIDVYASQDPYCCGDSARSAEAAALGYTTNCDYVHGGIADLIADGAVTGLSQIRVDDNRHVIFSGFQYSAIVDQVDVWLAAILADNPTIPVWP